MEILALIFVVTMLALPAIVESREKQIGDFAERTYKLYRKATARKQVAQLAKA